MIRARPRHDHDHDYGTIMTPGRDHGQGQRGTIRARLGDVGVCCVHAYVAVRAHVCVEERARVCMCMCICACMCMYVCVRARARVWGILELTMRTAATSS